MTLTARNYWWLACGLAAWLCALPVPTLMAQQSPVTVALDLYDRGQYQESVAGLSAVGSADRNFYKTFEKEANAWIKAGGASGERRTIIAATVALEVAHLLRGLPADHAGRYLLWSSKLMRKAPSTIPSKAERLWYLASIAGMEELGESWPLALGLMSPSYVFSELSQSIGNGGQVAHAIRRFPDEPRFQLSRIAHREWRVKGWFPLVPSFTTFAHNVAAGHNAVRPPDELTAVFMRNQAQGMVNRHDEVPDIIAAYESLATQSPALRPEVDLHIGYLNAVLGDWPRAIEYLRRIPSQTDAPYLRYLSAYFRGRVLQYQGDRPAAISAFEDAIAILPNARSASAHLAAALFLGDRAADRERAYVLLQAAHSAAAPEDPWRLYSRGGAWLWPTHMAQLREALR